MTAQVLHNYSPAHFDALPSIDTAEARFKAFGGIDKIEDAFAEVAKKHPSAADFGLQLLHRHSDIAATEIMLGNSHTTIPIAIAELSEAGLANTFPTVWTLDPSTDTFLPLEFAHVEADDKPIPALDAELAADIAKLIKQYGLEKIIGLGIVNDDLELGLEVTHGRANVIIPFNVFKSSSNAVEVLWQLKALGGGAKESKRRCKVICWRDDRGRHHPNAHQYQGPHLEEQA